MTTHPSPNALSDSIGKHLDFSKRHLSQVPTLSLSGISGPLGLDLSYNVLEDVSALANYPKLKHLNLAHNRLHSGQALGGLSALRRLAHLQYLDLSFDAVARLDELGPFPELEYLNLSGNALSDVQALLRLLEGCPKLHTLNLAFNAFSDISGIERFGQLRRLDLGYNFIQDFSPLDSLSLEWVVTEFNDLAADDLSEG